jgi:hypothetical protein
MHRLTNLAPRYHPAALEAGQDYRIAGPGRSIPHTARIMNETRLLERHFFFINFFE